MRLSRKRIRLRTAGRGFDCVHGLPLVRVPGALCGAARNSCQEGTRTVIKSTAPVRSVSSPWRKVRSSLGLIQSWFVMASAPSWIWFVSRMYQGSMMVGPRH